MGIRTTAPTTPQPERPGAFDSNVRIGSCAGAPQPLVVRSNQRIYVASYRSVASRYLRSSVEVVSSWGFEIA